MDTQKIATLYASLGSSPSNSRKQIPKREMPCAQRDHMELAVARRRLIPLAPTENTSTTNPLQRKRYQNPQKARNPPPHFTGAGS